MFGEDYAYAVARIRVLETGLLNQAAIEQLLACQDEQQCLQILTETVSYTHLTLPTTPYV